MKIITIGIVDYGMGNHASVVHSLRHLGFRVRITKEPAHLDLVDALVLPGVGAFPTAMQTLHEEGLVTYLQEQARLQRPLIGICLGMELLASVSYEYNYTAGLDLIPGEIVPFANQGWHIGWNTLECTQRNEWFQPSDGLAFYFNHSFYYEGPMEYQIAVTRHPVAFAAVIRRGSVVGLQFHPEKSQTAGKELLKNLIMGLVRA
ncbi:MAG: imidazole glycerol phosphate synthase subunit HisH [Syntrophaceae bacterium]|nr:imidazole glycerol phosphate synthase subunit HisH [Syntrophaceae bacterium]